MVCDWLVGVQLHCTLPMPTPRADAAAPGGSATQVAPPVDQLLLAAFVSLLFAFVSLLFAFVSLLVAFVSRRFAFVSLFQPMGGEMDESVSTQPTMKEREGADEQVYKIISMEYNYASEYILFPREVCVLWRPTPLL
jgi:hypothetical protein